jgi:hypothetical protein
MDKELDAFICEGLDMPMRSLDVLDLIEIHSRVIMAHKFQHKYLSLGGSRILYLQYKDGGKEKWYISADTKYVWVEQYSRGTRKWQAPLKLCHNTFISKQIYTELLKYITSLTHVEFPHDRLRWTLNLTRR